MCHSRRAMGAATILVRSWSLPAPSAPMRGGRLLPVGQVDAEQVGGAGDIVAAGGGVVDGGNGTGHVEIVVEGGADLGEHLPVGAVAAVTGGTEPLVETAGGPRHQRV